MNKIIMSSLAQRGKRIEEEQVVKCGRFFLEDDTTLLQRVQLGKLLSDYQRSLERFQNFSDDVRLIPDPLDRPWSTLKDANVDLDKQKFQEMTPLVMELIEELDPGHGIPEGEVLRRYNKLRLQSHNESVRGNYSALSYVDFTSLDQVDIYLFVNLESRARFLSVLDHGWIDPPCVLSRIHR